MENTPTITTTDSIQGQEPTKRKRGRPRKGQVLRVYDRDTGAHIELPNEPLPANATLKDVIARNNKQTKALELIAENQAALHQHYANIRRRREINLPEIATLARKGMTKNSIAVLLGFQAGMYSERKDVEEAFQLGRAELEVALLDRQWELIQTTKGPILPIFYGKNYAGQQDTPDTQVNIQVNVADVTDKLLDKFNTVIATKASPEVIDAEVVDVTPSPIVAA